MAKSRKKKSSKIVSTHFNVPNFVLLVAVFALVGAVLLFLTKAATIHAFDPPGEVADVNRINKERNNRSLSTLRRSRCLTDIARRWSRYMAGQGDISHNSYGSWENPGPGLSIIYKNCGTDLNVVAENVGVGPSVEAIFKAFMNSSGHKSNIIYRDLNVVGVGAFLDRDSGMYYVTQIFSKCTNCGGEWKDAPADSCRPTTTYGGLLYFEGFELDNIDEKKWNDIRTTGKWYSWASAGSRPMRRGSTVTRADCWLMHLENPSNGAASVSQIQPATAGKTYTLKGYSRKVEGSSPQSLIIKFLDSNYNPIKDARAYTSTETGWKEVKVAPTTAPSGTKYVQAILYGTDGSSFSRYYWEDIDLRSN